MSILAVLTSPELFVAVIAGMQTVLLHIAIRNEGIWPVFKQFRIRRVLLLCTLSWAFTILFVNGR